MSAKYTREVTKIAKSRGWQVVRQGAHNQIILEYPPTKARTTILCTPSVRPPVRDLIRKFSAIETKSKNNITNEVVDWVCKKYGISSNGKGRLIYTMPEILKGYPGMDDPAKVGAIRRAFSHSDRVWMTTFSTRGTGGTPTERLVLGSNAILSPEELALVQSVPQVNDIIQGQKSVNEMLADMRVFLRDRGWVERAGGTWSFPEKALYGLRAPDAYLKAQGMPVTVQEPEPESDPIHPTWEEQRAADEELARERAGVLSDDEKEWLNPDHGVVPVEGEEPAEALPSVEEQNEKAAEVIGLPVALVTALRDYLKIDNKNTIAGLDMVREAMSAAARAHNALGKALEDLGEAIDLVKAEG